MTHETGPDSTKGWAQRLRAVAFDMDGLMVNTEELYTEVSDTILQRRGKRFNLDLKRRMMGLPAAAAFRVMIDDQQLDDSIETLAAETEEVFETLLPTRLQLLPGVTSLLDHLQQRGIPRCVATSSTHRFAQRVLRQVGIRERFAFVITADDVPRGKPAPDIYLRAAEQLGVDASEMLVLEDSQNGATAGRTAGACTVAVPGAHSQDHCFDGVCAQVTSLEDKQIYALLA